MINKTEEAYKKILKLLKEHENIIVFDVNDLEMKAKHHLFGVELKEKYGFHLDPRKITSLGWQKLRENIYIGWWGDRYRRTISWSDDGIQPEDELLLCISFPTGAYIFGGDYPTEFFQKFFLELKTFKPKYIDSSNKSLYFSMDNAGDIFNEYETILKKYYEENKKDIQRRKLQKMKDELAKFEAETGHLC